MNGVTFSICIKGLYDTCFLVFIFVEILMTG